MTAPLSALGRLFILAATVGTLLLVVVIGSSMAPTAAEGQAGAEDMAATGDSALRDAGVLRHTAMASGLPDVVMGSPLPATMEPPRPTPLPVTRRASVRSSSRPVPTAPLLNRWTVGAGDTLESIARQALGSASRWRDIVALNPGVNPRALKVGAVLKLPSATTPSGLAPPAQPASTPHTHIVTANESLSSIALQYLGSQNDWKRIYDANKGVLKRGPDSLKVGMKLVIPAR